MPTYRQLNAIRCLLSSALAISTEHDVTGALIQAVDEVDDMILELVKCEISHAESANALLAHVAGMQTMAVVL